MKHFALLVILAISSVSWSQIQFNPIVSKDTFDLKTQFFENEYFDIDLDNDGDIDRIATNSDQTILVNSGNGEFSINTDTILSVLSQYRESLVIDYNGDSYDDFIVYMRTPVFGKSIYFFTNDQNGGFTRTSVSNLLRLSNSVTGDIDGDGDQDFVGHTSSSNVATSYFNDGSGTFTVNQDTACITDYNTSINNLQLIDVDNDSDLDLMASSGNTSFVGSVEIWLNDGNGNFTEGNFSIPKSVDGFAILAEATGDNLPDLFIMNRTSSSGPASSRQLEVYQNQGGASFSVLNTSIPTVHYDQFDVKDMNNDGNADFIGKQSGGQEFSIFENTGNGSFQSATHNLNDYLLPRRHRYFQLGDWNTDGLQDIIIYNSSFSFINYNTGNFQFKQPVLSILRTRLGGDAKYGDINGDGFEDLVTFGTPHGLHPYCATYFNNGNGGFHSTPVALPDSSVNGDLHLFDADNDGDLDLFLNASTAASGAPISRLYHNDGSGNFVRSSASFRYLADDRKTVIKSADVNADGFEDLIIAGHFTNTQGLLGGGLYVYLRQSLHSYSTTTKVPNPGTSVSTRNLGDIAIADFNGDGHPDIYWTMEDMNVNRYHHGAIFQNDGNANFSPIINGGNFYKRSGSQSGDSDTADYDLDGDVDLIVNGIDENGSSFCRLFKNDGNAIMTEDLSTNIPSGGHGIVEFIDFDLDQDPDIVIQNADSLSLYLNDGTGNFTYESLSSIPKHYASKVLLRDFDKDDDIDIYTMGSYINMPITDIHTFIYQNQTNTFSFTEWDVQNSLHFYPNPTNGRIIIDNESPNEDVQITIMDMMGKVFYEEEFFHSAQIDINVDLPPGAYLIKKRLGKIEKSGKLVIY